MIFYVYAVVGMEAFFGKLRSFSGYTDQYADFTGFGPTILFLFQLFTTSNWQGVCAE